VVEIENTYLLLCTGPFLSSKLLSPESYFRIHPGGPQGEYGNGLNSSSSSTRGVIETCWRKIDKSTCFVNEKTYFSFKGRTRLTVLSSWSISHRWRAFPKISETECNVRLLRKNLDTQINQIEAKESNQWMWYRVQSKLYIVTSKSPDPTPQQAVPGHIHIQSFVTLPSYHPSFPLMQL